jgi:arylsulfatase
MRIKTPRYVKIALLGAALLSLTALVVYAQQITGTPGSPSATTTINGKQLPPPAPTFGGVIKDGALQSKPWWAPRVAAPKGAPNVLLIITDDAGFACSAPSLITPPNVGAGGGSCLPLMVEVTLGEPGVPVIC